MVTEHGPCEEHGWSKPHDACTNIYQAPTRSNSLPSALPRARSHQVSSLSNQHSGWIMCGRGEGKGCRARTSKKFERLLAQADLRRHRIGSCTNLLLAFDSVTVSLLDLVRLEGAARRQMPCRADHLAPSPIVGTHTTMVLGRTHARCSHWLQCFLLQLNRLLREEPANGAIGTRLQGALDLSFVLANGAQSLLRLRANVSTSRVQPEVKGATRSGMAMRGAYPELGRLPHVDESRRRPTVAGRHEQGARDLPTRALPHPFMSQRTVCATG